MAAFLLEMVCKSNKRKLVSSSSLFVVEILNFFFFFFPLPGFPCPNFDSLGSFFFVDVQLNNGHFLALGNCSVLFLIESGTLKVWKPFIFLLQWLRRDWKILFVRIFCLALERWHIIPISSHRGCLWDRLSSLFIQVLQNRMHCFPWHNGDS